MLTDRKAFSEGVFKRDNYKCVMCKAPAVDAHHILERRLWVDGGYHIDNGASLCSACHIEAEKTNITVEDLRIACGITKPLIPDHLYHDVVYDKWGNIVHIDETITPGELFLDESVQKILKDKLHLVRMYYKYPRTYHLPWSPGMNDDDRQHSNMSIFEGQRVIVTEKMDGENTTAYPNGYVHARSIDGRGHITREWVKNYLASRSYELPETYRMCGENLFAVHSIKYEDLKSFYYLFSIWNLDECLSWDETVEWAQLLEVNTVPVLYDGIYDEKIIRSFNDRDWSKHEGYVLRLANSFKMREFRNSVAKYVRKGHVQTTKHWMFGHNTYKINGLAE